MKRQYSRRPRRLLKNTHSFVYCSMSKGSVAVDFMENEPIPQAIDKTVGL